MRRRRFDGCSRKLPSSYIQYTHSGNYSNGRFTHSRRLSVCIRRRFIPRCLCRESHCTSPLKFRDFRFFCFLHKCASNGFLRNPRRRPHAWRRGGRSKEACFQMSHPIEQCVLWMAFLLRPSSLVNCHATCRGLSWDVGSPSSFFDDNICHQNTPARMLITGSCSGSRGAKGKD